MTINKTFSNSTFYNLNEGITFSGNPLDRLDGFRGDASWLDDKMKSSNSKFLLFQSGRPLMRITPELDIGFFSYSQASYYIKLSQNWLFLGGFDDEVWFVIEVDPSINTLETESQKWMDLKDVAVQLSALDNDKGRVAILGEAASMLNWHSNHGFCAKCGSKSRMGRGGFLRTCDNDKCGSQHFPRTDPVVIMLAIKGDKCLLGRSQHFHLGVYSALAGFMEPGESIEEAVRRELMEEAGIKVGRVDYLKSQPWPFPSNLMIGCLAEALTEEITLHDDELEDARWFSKKDVIKMLKGLQNMKFQAPTKIAISHHLMKYWAKKSK
ncbi:MAG: NAD(+) diphosphatase [Sphingomonadales bacterium]